MIKGGPEDDAVPCTLDKFLRLNITLVLVTYLRNKM
jgi:hypothetical protein